MRWFIFAALLASAPALADCPDPGALCAMNISQDSATPAMTTTGCIPPGAMIEVFTPGGLPVTGLTIGSAKGRSDVLPATDIPVPGRRVVNRFVVNLSAPLCPAPGGSVSLWLSAKNWAPLNVLVFTGP